MCTAEFKIWHQLIYQRYYKLEVPLLGRTSSDLRHTDLCFDYRNLVDIKKNSTAAAAATAVDAAKLGEGLAPPQGRILFRTLQKKKS